MTTLENSYCVPRAVEECKALRVKVIYKGTPICKSWRGDLLAQYTDNDRTEIPVPHFLDLLHDRIAGWRLEDAKFDKHPKDNKYALKCDGSSVIVDFEFGVDVFAYCKPNIILFPNITTFTDLLTLIRMLTPPSND